MRKLLTMLALALLPLSLPANINRNYCLPACGGCYCPDYVRSVSFMIGAGYRQDNLNWSVGGDDDDQFPLFLSKLDWKRLNIWTMNTELDILFCNHIVLSAEGSWGRIYHGRVRDSDYVPFFDGSSSFDDALEFSRSVAHVKGCVYDVSASIGYQYMWLEGDFVTTPLAGYSYHAQRLHMYDGTQLINFDPFTGEQFFLGHIPDLNSSYKTRWRSPWIGMNLQWNMDPCFSIYGEYQYHWATYRAGGHWNLRDDLPDGFSHHARGKGQLLKAGGEWGFCSGWTLGLQAKYQIWNTYKGTEKTKILQPIIDAFGNETDLIIPVSTRLNRVNWRSLAFVGYLGFDW